jgi:hypothetical protein
MRPRIFLLITAPKTAPFVNNSEAENRLKSLVFSSPRCNRQVAGSSPALGSNLFNLFTLRTSVLAPSRARLRVLQRGLPAGSSRFQGHCHRRIGRPVFHAAAEQIAHLEDRAR